jgi:hypothetical protein
MGCMTRLRSLLISFVLTGCAHMSEARHACVSECSSRNDQCVVSAMNPETLQACDAEAKQCAHSCEDL